MAAGRRSRLLLLLLLLVSVLALVLALAAGLSGPSARASHILVSTEEQADELAALLDESEDLPSAFAELAAAYSQCPSAKKGGDLGTFGRGQMVPEFDAVVFERAVGAVHKVHTQFGWHLVLTSERAGIDEDDLEDDSDERPEL